MSYVTTSYPIRKTTVREQTIDAVRAIVCGDRETDYGSPEDNFKLIAELWSAYKGIKITPVDVAMMMSLLKIARIRTGRYKADSYIDAAGYVVCGAELAASADAKGAGAK